jgi:beta-lactam-binding protein with PASTA domain
VRAVMFLGALLLVASCSSPAPPPPQPPVPAEVVIGQTVIPGAKAPSGNLLPNVVGMVHQDAQDTLQAAGFHNLAEQDATGRDRTLIIDGNWVVVEQIPKAGTVLDPGQEVMLKSRKRDD